MKRILILLSLCLLIGAEFVDGQEVRRLSKTVAVQNPIRIVYFLDGVEQKDLEKWYQIVVSVNDSLMARPVFKEQEGAFEAVALLTPSKQSGVTYKDSTKVRDTYFGSYFENSDNLKLPDWGEEKMVVARTRLYPDFNRDKDISVVVVNDPRFSGRYAGYAIATYRKTDDVYGIIHEIGHHFGLMDERYFSYFPTLNPFPKYPNLVKIPKEEQGNISRNRIPWGSLIDSSTPLPTPRRYEFPTREDYLKYKDTVGLFLVSEDHEEYFASQLDCIMGSSSTPYFCKVCQRHVEGQIEKLLSLRPVLVGDFDGDGEVGLNDFFKFAEYFGAKKNTPRYSETYDLDKDGEVGFLDFFIFADHFGKKSP